MHVSVTQSCPTLCDPVDYSPPGSSVHGILQAGILVWVAISFSRGSSWPRDQTHVSCVSRIDRQTLYYWATREAPKSLGFCYYYYFLFPSPSPCSCYLLSSPTHVFAHQNPHHPFRCLWPILAASTNNRGPRSIFSHPSTWWVMWLILAKGWWMSKTCVPFRPRCPLDTFCSPSAIRLGPEDGRVSSWTQPRPLERALEDSRSEKGCREEYMTIW